MLEVITGIEVYVSLEKQLSGYYRLLIYLSLRLAIYLQYYFFFLKQMTNSIPCPLLPGIYVFYLLSDIEICIFSLKSSPYSVWGGVGRHCSQYFLWGVICMCHVCDVYVYGVLCMVYVHLVYMLWGIVCGVCYAGDMFYL